MASFIRAGACPSRRVLSVFHFDLLIFDSFDTGNRRYLAGLEEGSQNYSGCSKGVSCMRAFLRRCAHIVFPSLQERKVGLAEGKLRSHAAEEVFKLAKEIVRCGKQR